MDFENVGGSWADLGWILKRAGVDIGWILGGSSHWGGCWVDLELWEDLGWILGES